MRNVFDQYEDRENRLTHALLCALDHDRRLLRSFLRRFANNINLSLGTVQIVEQKMPHVGEQISKERTESVPDGVIYDDDKKKKSALIIESKIAARLTNDQLNRHYAGLQRSEFFSHIKGLAITADKKAFLPPSWKNVSWSDIYEWLCNESDISTWQQDLKHFFEITEAQMVDDGRLGDRSITRFNGIPFGRVDSTYTYLEAKRLLRLLRSKILADKRASKKLGINPAALGRKAITGQQIVWDYFQLQTHPKGKNFTYSPHMTFAIGPEYAGASITIPNGIRRDVLRSLRNASIDDFNNAAEMFLSEIAHNFRNPDGIRPILRLLQRRYATQRSQPMRDADLRVDLRTVVKTVSKKRQRPKYQPEWLQMAQVVIRNKHSNLQLQVGCEFDYGICPDIDRPVADQLFVKTWQAARVFFKCVGADI